MTEQPKKQGIPWMTPEQAADFLKEIRESAAHGKGINQRDDIGAMERPKARKKDAHSSDLIGM